MRFKKAFSYGLFSISLFSIKVASVKADVVTYKLLNGDSISGELLEEESTDTLKVLIHPQLGRVQIKKSSIALEPINQEWETNLEIGIDGTTSRSYGSFGSSLDLETNFVNKVREFNFVTSYDFEKSSKNGDREIIAINKVSTIFRYDQLLDKIWATYFSTDYEYNALNKIGTNDLSTSIGLALKLIDNTKTNLRVSVGPSFEFIDGGEDCSSDANCGSIIPGGLFGIKYNWFINEKLRFFVENKYGTQIAKDFLSSNSFSTVLKYFPIRENNLYTSLSYENLYVEMKEPSRENSYKIRLGTTF